MCSAFKAIKQIMTCSVSIEEAILSFSVVGLLPDILSYGSEGQYSHQMGCFEYVCIGYVTFRNTV